MERTALGMWLIRVPAWLRRDVAYVGLAGMGGICGYTFSILVAHVGGPLAFGVVVAASAIGGTVSLPALLVALPAAQWARQADGLEPVLRAEGVALAAGGATGAVLWATAHLWMARVVDNPAWLWPVIASVVPVYANNLQYGALLGRGATTASAILLPLPNLLKVGVLFVVWGLAGGRGSWVDMALWAMAAGVWGTWAAGFATIASLREAPSSTGALPSRALIWPSGLTTLFVNAWLGADTAVVSQVFAPGAVAVWAAIATVGRLPFHLGVTVINNAIMAKDRFARRRALTLLVSLTVALAGAVVAVGPWLVELLFKVRLSSALPLLLYIGANALITWTYLDAARTAGEGRHVWWPLATSLALWAVFVFAVPMTVVGATGLWATFAVLAFVLVRRGAVRARS